MSTKPHPSLDSPPQLSGIVVILDDLHHRLDRFSYAHPDLKPEVEAFRRRLSDLHSSYSGWAKEHPPTPAEQRFWQRTVTSGIHILWTGMSRTDGREIPICNWTADGRTIRTTAARVAWLLMRGQQVPDGNHLRKRCDAERCISPDCHEPANDGRPKGVGRPRKDITYGAGGIAMCNRRGHVLSRLPKPGQKLYCPACYALDKLELAAHDAAHLSAMRASRNLHSDPDPAPYAPLPTYVNTTPTVRESPEDMKRRLMAEINDLFEPREDSPTPAGK